MDTPASSSSASRRQFLTKSIAAGTSLCCGCSYFLSLAQAQDAQEDNSFEVKVADNCGMSYQQLHNFAFRDILVPQLIALSHQIGREKFIEMLKTASDATWFDTKVQNRFYANLPKGFWRHVLNLQVLEDSPSLRVYKVTRCLWANTFREADAADIGYAMWCYGDYAIARSEKKKLHRDTTLMQGHDCCLLRWTKEA